MGCGRLWPYVGYPPFLLRQWSNPCPAVGVPAFALFSACETDRGGVVLISFAIEGGWSEFYIYSPLQHLIALALNSPHLRRMSLEGEGLASPVSAAEIEGRGGIVPNRPHNLLHDFHCLAFVRSLKILTIARVGRISGGP